MKNGQISKPLDKEKGESDIINLEELRCKGIKPSGEKCNSLLAKHEIYYGKIEIKCYNCREINTFVINKLEI